MEFFFGGGVDFGGKDWCHLIYTGREGGDPLEILNPPLHYILEDFLTVAH